MIPTLLAWHGSTTQDLAQVATHQGYDLGPRLCVAVRRPV